MPLVQKEVKAVYLGTHQVRHAGGGWTPGANTVVWFPFNEDLLDHSGNGYSMTSYGSIAIGTVGGVSCLDCSSSSKYLSGTVAGLPQGNQVRTEIMWVMWKAIGNYGVYQYGNPTIQQGDTIWTNNSNRSPNGIGWSQYGDTLSAGNSSLANTWYNIAIRVNGNYQEIFLNGTVSNSSNYIVNTQGTTLYLGRNNWDNTSLNGYLSNFIIEDRLRTDQEISDYYNNTKSTYGIS